MTKQAWDNIPKAKKAYKARSSEEDSLTFAVAAWLHLALRGTDVAWTHFPAGEKRTVKTGAKLKKMGLKPGWPDFIFLMRSHQGVSASVTSTFIGIDLKSKTGKQSASQKDVQAQIEAAGGYYYLARSIPEVAGYLMGHGIDLQARAV